MSSPLSEWLKTRVQALPTVRAEPATFLTRDTAKGESGIPAQSRKIPETVKNQTFLESTQNGKFLEAAQNVKILEQAQSRNISGRFRSKPANRVKSIVSRFEQESKDRHRQYGRSIQQSPKKTQKCLTTTKLGNSRLIARPNLMSSSSRLTHRRSDATEITQVSSSQRNAITPDKALYNYMKITGLIGRSPKVSATQHRRKNDLVPQNKLVVRPIKTVRWRDTDKPTNQPSTPSTGTNLQIGRRKRNMRVFQNELREAVNKREQRKLSTAEPHSGVRKDRTESHG